MAFSTYSGSTQLEASPMPPEARQRHPLLALTRGLGAVLPPGGGGGSGGGSAVGKGAGSSAAALMTLPDGRLHAGTHLPLMVNRYRYLSTVGEGVSAQVLLAEDTLAAAPGRLVAIKAMRRQHALAGQREARALRYLHGCAPGGVAPGVVQLLDSFQLGAHYCLVTERLYPWLLDWIAESSALPPAEALRQLRKMAHQLLCTVSFLHCQGVVHADIKPDNILLQRPPGSHGVGLRLVDFGGAFSLSETDRGAVACEVQTLPYRAPEAALGLPSGSPVDLWSVGVVLAEVALKRALLPCATPRDLLHQMAALLGPLPEALVHSSALGQHMDVTPLLRPAAAAEAPLPADLQQRTAAAAALSNLLQVPQARRSTLHAELAHVDASLADLVMRLLAYDPSRRITARQALLHPFFDPLCPLRALFPQLQHPQQHTCRPQQDPSWVAAAGPTTEDKEVVAAVRGPAAGMAGRPEPARQAARPVPVLPGAVPAAAPRASQPPARAAGHLLLSGNSPALPAALAAAAAAEAAAAVEAAGGMISRDGSASTPWGRQEQQQQQTREQQGSQPALPAAAAAQPAAAHQPEAEAPPAPLWQQQQQQRGSRKALTDPHLPQSNSSGRGLLLGGGQLLDGRQPLEEQPPQPHWKPKSQAPQLQAAAQQLRAQPPAARLPAVELAARQWEEERRLAAGNPYAGSFSPGAIGPTPCREAHWQAPGPAGQGKVQLQQAPKQQRAVQQQWAAEEKQHERMEREAGYSAGPGSPSHGALAPAVQQSATAVAAAAAGHGPDNGPGTDRRPASALRQQLKPPEPAAAAEQTHSGGQRGAAAAGRTTARKAPAGGLSGSTAKGHRPVVAGAVAAARRLEAEQAQQAERVLQQAKAFDLLLEAAAAGSSSDSDPEQRQHQPHQQQLGASARASSADAAKQTRQRRRQQQQPRRPVQTASAGRGAKAPVVVVPPAAGAAATRALAGVRRTGKAQPAARQPATAAAPGSAPKRRPAQPAEQQLQQPLDAAPLPRQHPDALPGAGAKPAHQRAGRGMPAGAGQPGAAALAAGGSKTPAAQKKRRQAGSDGAAHAVPAVGTAAPEPEAESVRDGAAPLPATAAKRRRESRPAAEPKPWWMV